MGWSQKQLMTLSLLPKFSSFCTFWGCIWIMTEVLTDNNSTVPKRHQPYHRLLFAISFYDWLESMFNFMSTWTIPADSPAKTYGSVGNQATCNAQGFFLQLALAAPMYNACLALYYLLVIRYGVTDKTLRKWVEPAMHAVVMLVAFGTAIASVRLELFNSALLWCWIAPSPPGCLDSARYGHEKANCVRGDNAWIYRWGFYFGPLWFCILFATVCTLMVFDKVRRLDRRTLQYRRPSRASIMSAHFSSRKFDDISTLSGNALSGGRRDSGAKSKRVRRGAVSIRSEKNQGNNDDNDEVYNYNDEPIETNSPSRDELNPGSSLQLSTFGQLPVTKEDASGEVEDMGSSEDRKPKGDENADANSRRTRVRLLVEAMTRQTSNRTVGRRQMPWQNRDQTSDQLEENVEQEQNSVARSFSSVKNLYSKWQSQRKRFAQDNPRTVEVFSQACFYLGAFYVSNCWSTSNRIIQMIHKEKTNFRLSCFHAFFDPFQGFLNFLVYQRPRYLRIRKQYPHLSRLEAARRTLQFSCQGRAASEGSDMSSDRQGRKRWRSKAATVSSNSGVVSAESLKDADPKDQEPANQPAQYPSEILTIQDEFKEDGPLTAIGFVSPDKRAGLNPDIAAAIVAAASQVDEQLNDMAALHVENDETVDTFSLPSMDIEPQTDDADDGDDLARSGAEPEMESPTAECDPCECHGDSMEPKDRSTSHGTKSGVSWAPGL